VVDAFEVTARGGAGRLPGCGEEETVDTHRFTRLSTTGVAAALAAIFTVSVVSPAAAQLGAIRGAARRVAEEAKKTEDAKRKTEETKKAEETKKTEDPAKNDQPVGQSAAAATAPAASFEAYSKFDFVPGEKIVALEDFTQDAIGDFPAKWNTDASGEIVTVSGQSGRWLKLTKAGFFTPEFITQLPENVTVEFDLLVRPGFSAGFPLEFALAQLANPNQAADWESGPNTVNVTAFPGYGGNATQGVSAIKTRLDGASGTSNQTNTTQLTTDGKAMHIAAWRQRQRVRVYMNQEKVWDLPRAVSASAKLNSLVFLVRGGCGNCEYYLGNLRVAAGAPDTRNKLITEGKWVTHGILFDSGSDRVKPESYGSLKEIAGVLTENADLKVQVVGHTDADGDDAANLDLSKRRAAAVRAVLVSEFKIDAGRLDVDGKGEGQPIDKNDTPAGKANNRRVEFIKR
jgi:outer membrane protein OmpA-like peptidoglycan-associated protein